MNENLVPLTSTVKSKVVFCKMRPPLKISCRFANGRPGEQLCRMTYSDENLERGVLDAVAVKRRERQSSSEEAALRSDKTFNKASRWAFASGNQTRRRTCLVRAVQARAAQRLHQTCGPVNQHRHVCVEKCPLTMGHAATRSGDSCGERVTIALLRVETTPKDSAGCTPGSRTKRTQSTIASTLRPSARADRR